MKHLKHREKKSVRFAVCLNNSGYKASLELHKIYRIIPDEDTAEDGDIRIVDESGEDYFHRKVKTTGFQPVSFSHAIFSND